MAAKDPELCDHKPHDLKPISEDHWWCRSCGTLIEKGPGFTDYSYPWGDY